MQFSIIIPTYNRADKIGTAIKSVLNQKYIDFELIIVDDGSTDNTLEVVEMFKDNRIHYFKKENEERNIARNYGIKMAKGEYIGFLDSDDILYNNHLNEAYLMISTLRFPEIIHLNFERKNSSLTSSTLTEKHIQDLNSVLINENVLSCNSMIIKREVISKYQFLNSSDAIISEDHYLWLRLAVRYKIYISLAVTSAVIEHKSRSLNSIDVEKLKKGIEEIINALKRDKKFLIYYGWKANRFFSYKYIFVALQLVTQHRKLESAKYLFIALKDFPPIIFSKRFLAVTKHLIMKI